MRPDYYAVLGVPRDATAEAVRRAYRSLAGRYHPDVNPDDPAALGRFKGLVEAHGVLGDPARRAAYDAGALPTTPAIERAGGFAEAVGGVVDRLFGVRDRRPRDGRNHLYRVTVPFVDAMRGSTQHLTLPTRAACTRCDGRGVEPGAIPEICGRCGGDGEVQSRPFLRATRAACEDCDGRGYVTDRPCAGCDGGGEWAGSRALEVPIPAGVEDGQILRLRGEGAPGRHGGADGDCLVEITVRPHPHLRRDGRDLVVERPLPIFLALAGGAVSVPTLEGPTTIRVPAGTEDGATLRLAGYGLPSGSGAGGDLRVRVALELPDGLDEDARATLATLAQRVGTTAFPRASRFDAAYAPEARDDS